MRILLITYHFPPFNQIGAVRLGKMAKYLREAGHEVRVLTANDYLRNTDLELEIPSDAVTYTPWIDINKPGRIFYRQKGPVVEHANAPPPHPVVEKMRLIYEAVLNFPDDRVGWLPYALAEGSRLIKSWRPDVIYASGAPFVALVAASRLASKFGIPWVAELRDLWADNHNYRLPLWRQRLDGWLERRVLSSAQGVVTVTEPWANALKEKYEKPTACIPNGFDSNDFPERIEQGHDNVLRLVYTGAFYPTGQDPAPLFAALKLLGSVMNSIQVQFIGTVPHKVLKLARDYGVESRLKFSPSVPYRESLFHQVQADVLLLLLWQIPPGCYPGKTFEYIGARRPILAVGPSTDIAAKLVSERDAGIISDQPADIAVLLKKWLIQKKSGGIPSLKTSVNSGLSRKERAADLMIFLEETLADYTKSAGRP